MKNCDPLILSIDAGGTALKAALAAGDRLLAGSFISIPIDSGGSRDSITCSYRSLGEAAEKKASRAGLPIAAAAVCIPGPFDYKRGCSLMIHKYAAVYQLPLAPFIWEGLGRMVPTRFMHDSTAFLLGCVTDNDRAARRRICGVIIGAGLGFASMIDGKILENPQGVPGISIFGRPYLGKTAEDFISRRGILKRFEELSPDFFPGWDVKDIAAAAKSGNTQAIQVFEELGFHLGTLLLPILEEWRFEQLFLGGAISKSASLFLPSLHQALGKTKIRIAHAPSIDGAPLLGAARNYMLQV